MSSRRALVLDTGKRLFEQARAPFAGRVEFLDIRAGHSVPRFEPERDTLRAIDAVMARTPFQHVLATSESNLAFAAFLRARYGLAGMGFDDALAVTNKWRMKQRLGAALPTAPCWLSGDFVRSAKESLLDRPDAVVLKPLTGSSSKGVRRMATPEALRALSEGDDLWLVEAAVDIDRELHCDGVVRGGELLAALPSAYDRPVLDAAGRTRASIHLPADDPAVDPALAVARKFVAALGVADFVFHLELFEVDGELLFGEVGLRPAGGGVAESLHFFHGVDIWQEFVRLQLGEPPGIGTAPEPPAHGYRGVCGIAASATGPDVDEAVLRDVPGVVHLSPGSPKARQEAAAGSSCAFGHFALFDVEDEERAHVVISLLGQRAAGRAG